MSHHKPDDYLLQNGCWNCGWCFKPWNPECWEGYCAADCGVEFPAGLLKQWRDALQFKNYPGPRHLNDEERQKARAWQDEQMRPYNDWDRFRDVRPYGKCGQWEDQPHA